jgi:hypothetical protein
MSHLSQSAHYGAPVLLDQAIAFGSSIFAETVGVLPTGLSLLFTCSHYQHILQKGKSKISV